jgi:hypothetical protein
MLLSLILIIVSALIFGDSAEVAENADSLGAIIGLFAALFAAFGIHRLLSKPRKRHDPFSATG